MDIDISEMCNEFNILHLEKYLCVEENTLHKYYTELKNDEEFLNNLNARKKFVRDNYSFSKGLFGVGDFDRIDWFAFERILLYILVRHFKPDRILETGVYYGGNTVFLLKAIDRNKNGELISIDYPDYEIRDDKNMTRHPEVKDTELYENNLSPGFLVPENLRNSWKLIIGDSHKIIPTLDENFDLYLHDSEHSYDFVKTEILSVLPKLRSDSIIVVDDIDWSNGFFSICDKHKFHPLLLTDNGKDNLRVRTGLVKLNHRNNNYSEFVG